MCSHMVLPVMSGGSAANHFSFVLVSVDLLTVCSSMPPRAGKLLAWTSSSAVANASRWLSSVANAVLTDRLVWALGLSGGPCWLLLSLRPSSSSACGLRVGS